MLFAQYLHIYYYCIDMIAAELINYSLPQLLPTDTVGKALELMDEFKLTFLPVVENDKYLGIIAESRLFELDEEAELLKYIVDLPVPSIKEDQHLLDAFMLMDAFKINMLPVLNIEGKYLGYFTDTSLANAIAKLTAVQQPGGILILEMFPSDYTLTQIAQIVEGNNASILASYITPQVGSNKIEVTLKINKEDLAAIIQTFNRFNYTVRSVFHVSQNDDDIKRRYDQLMNYINM